MRLFRASFTAVSLASALVSALVLAPRSAAAQAMQFPEADALLADTRWLTDALLRDHPRLQRYDDRRRFEERSAELQRRMASLPAATRVLELARLVASLEDGHTGLAFVNDARLPFHRYPLEVTSFADGIFVSRAGASAARLLGKRLVRVGAVPIADLLRRVEPYLFGDNAFSRRNGLPSRLTLHELLVHVGAADASGATYVVADSAGRLDSLRFDAGSPPEPLTRSARDEGPLPLYLRNGTASYWFTSLPGGVVYAQINALVRGPGSAFDRFADSVFREVDTRQARSLVIDIRQNGGGDGTLAQPLLRRIARSTRTEAKDGLFVIIGRTTFSAAVILAARLEQETNAVFVGEPTGAPANHYGEPLRVELPATRLRLSYSTLYWQNGDPRDNRAWIGPSLPAPLTFADWKAQRDPAMETILTRLGVAQGGVTRALPLLDVGGEYPTRVGMISDECTGMDVRSMPTTIEHRPGDSTLVVVHAGNRMTGTVSPGGEFSTTPFVIAQGNVTYSVKVSGQFTSSGFRALARVDVTDAARGAPCRFTAGWIAQKAGDIPNSIPRSP